jgi:hypothetical protein
MEKETKVCKFMNQSNGGWCKASVKNSKAPPKRTFRTLICPFEGNPEMCLEQLIIANRAGILWKNFVMLNREWNNLRVSNATSDDWRSRHELLSEFAKSLGEKTGRG